jgi:hypothetical protein
MYLPRRKLALISKEIAELQEADAARKRRKAVRNTEISVLSSVTAVQIFRFKSVKVQVFCLFSPKDTVKCWILSA